MEKKTFEFGLKFKVSQEYSVQERFLAPFFRDLISFFSSQEMPVDLIMFSVESYLPAEKKCEIIFIAGEDTKHLGRMEEYSRCIFSAYADKSGDIVVLDNVKRNPAYLELDSRVNSEIFYEHAVDNGFHILINAEFSSSSVGKQGICWFEKIVDFLK
jgi:hypothetical protein